MCATRAARVRAARQASALGGAPIGGMAPSCASMVGMSMRTQFSTNCPFSARHMWIQSTVTRRPVAGMPGFTHSMTLSRVDEPQAVSAIDVDGDGKPDLCLAGGDRVSLVPNYGTSLN